MSRCFPFPPPGYILNGIRDEVMITSIKGAEEKAKKEQRRKEKKRDKKDKKDKKEKKDKKRKERERGEGESEKHSHKRRRKEGVKDGQNQKVDVFRKVNESSLEKSSLTVERELLQSTSQNSCDSTLNSNEKIPIPKQKEKQQQQPPLDGRHNNNDSESIIRIRLPSRRQKDPEVMMMMMTNKDEQKLCPSRVLKLDSSQPAATREKPRGLKLDSSQPATTKEMKPVNQQHPCSTSAPENASKKPPHEEKRKDPILKTKLGKEKKSSKSTTQETYQPSSLCRICPPSMAVQFLNLVENWVPNTVETRAELTNNNTEDEECWWFTKKPSNHHKFGTTERCKQVNRNNEMKQVTAAWPCARLLPEADVHALPYTVPF